MKEYGEAEQLLHTEKLSRRDRTMACDRALIHRALQEESALSCLFALRRAALNHIDDADTLAIIKTLCEDHRWEFCMHVSDAATAAWHILTGEAYTGSNELVQCLIETNFCSEL